MTNLNTTLVTFHIGRGGQFNNAGHLSFVESDERIDKYTNELVTKFKNLNKVLDRLEFEYSDDEDFDLDAVREKIAELEFDMDNDALLSELAAEYGVTLGELGDLIYVDVNGNPVGLNYINNGIGRIDLDGQYNTTYVKYLTDCNSDELTAIVEESENSGRYVNSDVLDFAKEKLVEGVK